MNITKAIKIARQHARDVAEAASHLARANGRESRTKEMIEIATALDTVCHEVETLRETCRGYAAALTHRDSGQIQAESDESGDVGEMLGWQ